MYVQHEREVERETTCINYCYVPFDRHFHERGDFMRSNSVVIVVDLYLS